MTSSIYLFCFLKKFLQGKRQVVWTLAQVLSFEFRGISKNTFFTEHLRAAASDSIKWPNLITWLPLLLKILGNMCIVIIYFPVCDVINFEIGLSFLIKLFPHMTNKGQRIKYLKNEKSFSFLRWNKKHLLKQIKTTF